ncbi:DUF2970 domain-containing protein [Thiomonas sp. X19]|uniref:DUF2970 domain-containing protein n=1 Tax=Thiomonas sp. X19 TaxID=1050370 RepID=UPI001E4C9029|nr:DUF2970 domain-containing protein [Thiomonas sp. X19]
MEPKAPKPAASFRRGTLRALGAVATAMLGLRRRQDRERDFAALKLQHVVVAGVIVAVVIVTLLIVLVNRIAA